MKALFCASEAAPLAKTGGLADVVGALPPQLHGLGHDVRIVLPLYGTIDRDAIEMSVVVEQLGVPLGMAEQWCRVLRTTLPGSDVPLYLVEHDRFFDRPRLYDDGQNEYEDNAERFAFFSRACLQLCKALHWSPDVVHCHDWQTALIPVYLRTWEADHPLFWGTASVLTIHNLGYQGVFPKHQIMHCQLGWERFTQDGLEYHDQLNYLKGGILYADKVTTVSPTYAEQIQQPEEGCGLHGVLKKRAPDLVGILNGCDYREWDPAADEALPEPFSATDLDGKAAAKRTMQEAFGLPEAPGVPVLGVVSRLAHQKGFDVLAAAIERILRLDVQFVLLGTGEAWANSYFGDLPRRFAGKAATAIEFDETKAHLIYAGSDLFLMPSRYEPCGITQMVAMAYGSLPVARNTGGLADTVTQYDEATGAGTGFLFDDLTADALFDTVGWAVSTWYDRPHHHLDMVRRAMAERFDWTVAARSYAELYGWAVDHKREY